MFVSTSVSFLHALLLLRQQLKYFYEKSLIYGANKHSLC